MWSTTLRSSQDELDDMQESIHFVDDKPLPSIIHFVDDEPRVSAWRVRATPRHDP